MKELKSGAEVLQEEAKHPDVLVPYVVWHQLSSVAENRKWFWFLGLGFEESLGKAYLWSPTSHTTLPSFRAGRHSTGSEVTLLDRDIGSSVYG